MLEFRLCTVAGLNAGWQFSINKVCWHTTACSTGKEGILEIGNSELGKS